MSEALCGECLHREGIHLRDGCSATVTGASGCPCSGFKPRPAVTAPTTEQVREARERLRKDCEHWNNPKSPEGLLAADIQTVLDALDDAQALAQRERELRISDYIAPAPSAPAVTPMVTDEDVERAEQVLCSVPHAMHSRAARLIGVRRVLEDFASRKGAER